MRCPECGSKAKNVNNNSTLNLDNMTARRKQCTVERAHQFITVETPLLLEPHVTVLDIMKMVKGEPRDTVRKDRGVQEPPPGGKTYPEHGWTNT